MDKISILIASRNEEDRTRILAELSGQSDFYIVATEKDESGTIIKTEKLKPDVLIIDLYLEIVPMIRRRTPSTVIVFLFSNKENLSFAFNTGISGFLSKEDDLIKIAFVVRALYSGGYFYSSSVINITNHENICEQTGLFFSPAERGIVTLIAQGFTDMEIAEKINFSPGSVKNCVSTIKHKLKARNREHMIAYSIMYGLINPKDIVK